MFWCACQTFAVPVNSSYFQLGCFTSQAGQDEFVLAEIAANLFPGMLWDFIANKRLFLLGRLKGVAGFTF